MRSLSALALALMFAVATMATVWASAAAVGMAHATAPDAGTATHAALGHGAQVTSGHAAHAASGHAAQAQGHAPAPSAVLGVHPCGASPEACAAMALGCTTMTAHVTAADAQPVSAERSVRACRTFRDIVGAGLSPGLLDRPPRA